MSLEQPTTHEAVTKHPVQPLSILCQATRRRGLRRAIAIAVAAGATLSIGMVSEPAMAAPSASSAVATPRAAAAEPPVSGTGVDSPTCTSGTTTADNVCSNTYSFPSEATYYSGTSSLYNSVVLWHWTNAGWVQYSSSAQWSTYTYPLGSRLYYIRWGGVQGLQTVFHYPSRTGYWQFTWTTSWFNNKGALLTSVHGSSNLFHN